MILPNLDSLSATTIRQPRMCFICENVSYLFPVAPGQDSPWYGTEWAPPHTFFFIYTGNNSFVVCRFEDNLAYAEVLKLGLSLVPGILYATYFLEETKTLLH